MRFNGFFVDLDEAAWWQRRHTPASAYGPDFVLEAEGVTREDVG